MVRKSLFPSLVCCLLCVSARANQIGKDGTPYGVIQKGDKEMYAAIAAARKALPKFIWALQHPDPTRKQPCLKANFLEGAHSEYLWLKDVSYNGRNFLGTVDNEPKLIRNVKLGQRVTVPKSRVVDWVYTKNGVDIGAYMLQVDRKRASAKERADLDSRFHFKSREDKRGEY